jgi:hypothetical protein
LPIYPVTTSSLVASSSRLGDGELREVREKRSGENEGEEWLPERASAFYLQV